MAPNVTEYLDYRQFLRDYYQFRKSKDPGFSFARWAELAGFKSRSFVRLVMVGRQPLTDKSVPGFVRSMGLTGNTNSIK